MRLAEHVQHDEIDRSVRDCHRKLNPFSAAYACYEYWARLADGRAETAREPFQSVMDLGVPVPAYLLDGK